MYSVPKGWFVHCGVIVCEQSKLFSMVTMGMGDKRTCKVYLVMLQHGLSLEI